MLLAIFFCAITGTIAYLSDVKENFMSNVFLREIAQRMGKDLPSDLSYIDFAPSEDNNRLPLGVRSLNRDVDEEEQLFPIDYESLAEPNMHPSIRDQEFLEHSSLYGNQYMSGGAGEGKQRLRPEGNIKNVQEVKSDATLPAYCNPPNPCPVGYTSEQGCIEEFENTATFSRRYQAAQDCMCDTEHMFECPNPGENMQEDAMDQFNDFDFNRFLQHTMKLNPALQHKNLVAKKYHLDMRKKSSSVNPFLTGERLPVAAKKGKNVIF